MATGRSVLPQEQCTCDSRVACCGRQNGSDGDASATNWNDRMSSMERLLSVRVAKQEMLVLAVTEFVRQHLGNVFIERPAIDLPTL